MSTGGPQLAREIMRRWFTNRRRKPAPPRAARMIVEANDRTLIDISSRLALAMIDCDYSKPIVMEFELAAPEGFPAHRITITFLEAES